MWYGLPRQPALYISNSKVYCFCRNAAHLGLSEDGGGLGGEASGTHN